MKSFWLLTSLVSTLLASACASHTEEDSAHTVAGDSAATAHDVAAAASTVSQDGSGADSPVLTPAPTPPAIEQSQPHPADGPDASPPPPPAGSPTKIIPAPGVPDAAALDSVKRAKAAQKPR